MADVNKRGERIQALLEFLDIFAVERPVVEPDLINLQPVDRDAPW